MVGLPVDQNDFVDEAGDREGERRCPSSLSDENVGAVLASSEATAAARAASVNGIDGGVAEGGPKRIEVAVSSLLGDGSGGGCAGAGETRRTSSTSSTSMDRAGVAESDSGEEMEADIDPTVPDSNVNGREDRSGVMACERGGVGAVEVSARSSSGSATS